MVCSSELTLIGYTYLDARCIAKRHENSLLTGKLRGCIQYRPLYYIAIISLESEYDHLNHIPRVVCQ